MAAFDKANPSNSIVAPADNLEAVTPSDSVDLTFVSRAIYVGTGGNLAVIDKAGNTVTLTNVADGSIMPIRVTRVMSTNTTASDIVALS